MTGPIVVAPSEVTISTITVPITGVSITDPAAAANTGQMYLKVSCNNGTLSMSLSGVPVPGSSSKSIVMQQTFAETNAALASLVYECPLTISSADTISITVWDQYGLSTTTNIPVMVSSGVTANRIADLMERFGVNLYPMTTYPGNNFAGSSGNCSVSAITTALGWLTADASGTAFGSGLATLNRLWTYQAALGQFDLQTLASEIAGGCPNGVSFTMTAGGAPGSNDSIPYQITVAENSHNGTAPLSGVAQGCIKYVEGYNEPNGIGGETAAQTAAGQQEYSSSPVWNYTDVEVVGPPIVMAFPYPENTLIAWLGGEQSIAASSTKVYNVHFYPSGNPDFDDGSGRGGAMNDAFEGTNLGYGTAKSQIITEWHPTEYNSLASQIYNPVYDAYYTPIYILSAFRLGYLGYIWWALLDYSVNFTGNGLWPTDPTTDTPRNAAYVIRAMYALTGDTGSTKHTFEPSSLVYTVSGLPPAVAGSPNSGGQTMLFQNSSGTFFLYVWNSQMAPGGSSVPVTIDFANTMSITEYDLTTNPSANLTAVQTVANTKSITVQLNAGVRLLVIER